MTFLPIVERELRTAARRRSTFYARLGFTVLASLIVGGALVIGSITGPRGAAGGSVFAFTVYLVLAYCLVAGLLLTVDCISAEKREGTLGLLFLTDLRGYDVVLGKLSARSITALYGLIAVLPILSLTLLLGGVTGAEFSRVGLAFLGTLFLSLTAGVLASTFGRDDQKTLSAAFVLLLALTAAGPLVRTANASTWTFLDAFSPLSLCRAAFDTPYRAQPSEFWQALAGVWLTSAAFLSVAALALPRVWQDSGNTTANRTRTWGKSRRLRPRPRPDAANPVAWLATRAGLPDTPALWWFLLSLGAVIAIAEIVSGSSHKGDFRFVGFGLAFCLRALMAVQASRFFVEMRRTGALELLLCTPLSPRQIVDGQWIALRQRFTAPAVLVLAVYLFPVLWWLASVLTGGWVQGNAAGLFELAFWLFNAATVIVDLYAIGWFGMMMGLVAKRPTWAPTWTLLFTVLLPYLAFCVPRILIDLPLYFAARDRLYREVRRIASGPTGLTGLTGSPHDWSQPLPMPPPLTPRRPA